MPSQLTPPEHEQQPAPAPDASCAESPTAVAAPRRGMGFGVMLGKRMRRRTRWFFRCLIFLPLLVVLAGLLLMRSSMVGRVVERQLEAALGCEASTTGSFVMFDGRIVLRNLSLRVPGMSGPEGEFLRVPHAEIDADWSSPLTAGVKPKGVRLYQPMFRIAASVEGTTLNIQGLHPTDPDAMSGDRPIRIDVHSGSLELGESSATDYKVLRHVEISGEVVPDEKQPGQYNVRFREVVNGSGMVLIGRADLPSSMAAMELLNVDLSAWDPSSVPSLMRDVWKQLNVKGLIASTKLVYYPTTGLSVEVKLDGVSMEAIVPSEYPTADSTDVLSLRGVHGDVKLSAEGLHADVAGFVEDQERQSRVILRTHDLTTNAALDCTIISRGFQLEKDPRFLPFCPPVVAERLANFSGPTAVVDANVEIRRGPPVGDAPAPFSVEGWLTFEHGAAAFDRVPYPFTNMSGQVRFDDKAIEILRIRGEGPSGAQLLARGRIAPPNDDAAVNVEVKVRNAPLDETFMKSLPPSRAEAIDFLFNRARYDELLAKGLVMAPGGAGTAPVFAPGGRMDLDIVVNSPEGKDAPWSYQVDVTIPQAGVLTRAFPLPIDAKDVQLRLTDQEASLIAGEFRGLRGGQVEVATRVELEVDGQPVIRPSATIDARGVPIDDLLLHAIEYASGGAKPDGAAPGDALPAPAEILRTLRLDGDVNCLASISTNADESIGFDIGVDFEELTARPAREGSEPLVSFGDIAGAIHLTNTKVEVSRLSAVIRALDAAAQANSELAPGMELGWISASASTGLSGLNTSLSSAPDAPKSQLTLHDLRAAVDLTGLELAAPIEESLAAFSPSIAQRLADVRSQRAPAGRISATINATKPDAAGSIQLKARVTAAENVGFSAAGERMDATMRSGAIILDAEHGALAAFEKCEIDIGVGDLSRAPVSLDGVIVIEADPAQNLAPDSSFHVSGKDIPVECPAVSLVLRHVLSPEDLAAIVEANPSGRFDGDVSIPSTALVAEGGAPLGGIVAVIEPRTLRFDFEGTRVVVNSFDGRVTIGGGGIGVEKLVAKGDDWSAGIDGRWEPEGEGKGVFSARLDIVADSLTPGLRSLLPAGLRHELDRIELAIDGPIHCAGARVDYRTGGGDSSVIGEIQFSDASFDIGAPLSEAEGRLWLRASRSGGPGWSFGLDLEADRIMAAGLEMTGLRSSISVGKTPGELVIESLSADCYAGRVAARARVVTPPTDPAAPAGASDAGSAYEAEITMAGVCFAPVLAALEAERAKSDGMERPPMPTALSKDPRRGRIDGTIALSGVTGNPATRTGVGSARIAGGDVVEMPLVLTLVQLSNLQLPSSDRLDFLQALFHINREQIIFDQIDLLSSSVTIAGRGTMSWPGQELDLRFNSRSGNRVPVVTAVFEAVRDEIATTRIRGTLGSPQVSPEPLTGTRELIGSIVGDRSTHHRTTGLPDSRAERDRYRGLQPRSPARADADEN